MFASKRIYVLGGAIGFGEARVYSTKPLCIFDKTAIQKNPVGYRKGV